jgi:vacuolar-type H+-ATPase subunit D/Vma8
MDIETLKTLEALRQALVFFLEGLRAQQEKIYSFVVSSQALLDAAKSCDPELYKKYEEAYRTIESATHDSHVSAIGSIDAAMARLREVQKVN